MRNVTAFITLLLILGAAILVGLNTGNPASKSVSPANTHTVPSVGSIQVLNGCGINGAAGAVADYLRSRGFDVKDIDDARDENGARIWNYDTTIVVSRKKNMEIARGVRKALGTGKLILLRNDDIMYDVTVYLGEDFGEILE